MKNKKIFLAIVMIATTTHHCSRAWAWPAWITAVGNSLGKIEMPKPAGVAAVNAAGNVLKDNLPIVKEVTEVVTDGVVEVAGIVTDGVVETADILAPAAVNASAKIGVEAAKELAAVGKAAVVVVGIGVAAHSIVQLYPIGKEIVSNIRPSDELKAQRAASLKGALRRLNYLDAEEKFQNCLIEHRLNPDRGTSGLPRDCEAVAEIFGILGGRKEVDETTAFFNKCRK